MALPFILILGAVVLGTLGELLLKSGMNTLGELQGGSAEALARTVGQILTSGRILVGFACYGIAAVLWLVVLSKLDLSYAYPMLALTYALVPLSAHYLLGEAIPRGRWLGILIIIIGVLIVAYNQAGEG